MNSTSAASAHWRSSKSNATGPLLGHALEEAGARRRRAPPCRGRHRPRARAGAVSARLDEPPLLVVRQELFEHGAELRRAPAPGPRPRRCRRASGSSPRAPRSDALPVREAASAVPPDAFLEAVHVLEELPAEPRLADPGDADHGDELRPALVGARRGRAPSRAELAVAPTKGGSSPTDLSAPPRPAVTRSACQSGIGSALPLSSCSTGRREGDRRLGRAFRRFPDEHRARLGGRLDTRGGVDEIARDHALALGAECHAASPVSTPARACRPRVELRDGGDQVESCADGPLRVVLLRDRRTPDRHHRVADELLHGAAVALDQSSERSSK